MEEERIDLVGGRGDTKKYSNVKVLLLKRSIISGLLCYKGAPLAGIGAAYSTSALADYLRGRGRSL